MRKKRGFTLVEIMIAVSILGLLVTIAIPNFNKARELSQRNLCLQNQRVVLAGALTYDLETVDAFTDGDNGVTLRNTLMGNEYIRHMTTFECPVSPVEDYDDYRLTYDHQGISGIRCTVEPEDHAPD